MPTTPETFEKIKASIAMRVNSLFDGTKCIMDSGSVPTLILIALEEVGNAVEENPSQILDGTFVTESTIRNRIAMDVIQAVVREVSIEADTKEAILETIDTIFLAKEVDVLHAVKERRWSVLLAAALRQLLDDARCCWPKGRAEDKKRSVEAEAHSELPRDSKTFY
eukprot:scaffold2601_cov198-Pinguiococcus_pyrenoidosus.AAC.11